MPDVTGPAAWITAARARATESNKITLHRALAAQAARDGNADLAQLHDRAADIACDHYAAADDIVQAALSAATPDERRQMRAVITDTLGSTR